MACGDCGLVFRHPMPDDAELERLYRESYSQSNIAAGTTDMLSPEVAYRAFTRFIDRMAPPGARIVEFGAGTGELVARLRARGHDAVGIEPAAGARADACRRGVRLHASIAELAAEGGPAFDLAIAIEVVEHLKAPQAALRQLHDLLRPGGQLFVTTPNRDGLQARLRRCRWREARWPTHLMLYNFGALSRVLQAAGFTGIRRVRFSPLTDDAPARVVLHRILQAVGLYGGLRVIATRPA